MSPLREPLATFHVGHLERAGDTGAIAEQQLTARFADHRGRIELPALGVLFDHLGGIPYQLEQFKSGGFTIQARLSLSALGHIDVGDRLSCSADLATHDDQWGVTRVEIRTSTGRVCCVGSARNTVVGRSAELPTSLEDEAGGDIPDCADADGALLPLAIEPSLPGHDIVTQLASGVRSPGPLVELLNGAVEIEGEGRDTVVRLRVRTEPWMGNMFGTMHGGVIATIVGQAASLAGQAHTAPGQDYTLADLAVGFYRSPAVHGGDVVAEVVPIKLGRRIGSFEVTLTSHDGALLSRGTADVHYC
ncbi:PaaI family thioesterase [Gordonia sp. ABSL49_1]|uniref:PaaI family thioesterase n=1 Tax=Gordonia sp. ABSL49_1 TaxID=2920941 RepID=UPI001F0D0F5C|nr:PaaI family thioesterase [Gordonia sp. ABSL49_1]MCH5644665.1 PaaI family thioesterase [Gordonia sp. ABSL49_1]